MATILVVDDSATDRILAGGLLTKQADLEVVYAKNGQEALEKIDEHLPEAVVTDMQMPVMDGFELVREVKKRHPLIPVILMTAAGSEEIAVQALQEGASHYVPKRNLAQGLVRTVRRVLASSLENVNRNRLINRMTYREEEYVLEPDYSVLMALADQLPSNIVQLRICQPAERVRLCVAIEEALSNAFYHGNMDIDSKLRTEDYPACEELIQKRLNDPTYRDRKIIVKVRYTPEQATITIRDEGNGFDPKQIPNANGEAEDMHLESLYGRGILLMRTFMSEIHFNDKGNEVTLIKRRSTEVESDVTEDLAPMLPISDDDA